MTFPASSLLLVLLVPAAEDRAGPSYARPQLLVEAAELAKPGASEKFRIVDVRTRASYMTGHIPGAVWADPAAWSKLFAAHPDRDTWTQKLGAVAIDTSTPVVVYDDGSAKDSGRIWWILRYWGIEDVRLLNGGWTAWQSAKAPATKQVPIVAAVTPRLLEQRERHATKQDILDMLKGKEQQIIDARSEKEHCGDQKLARRGGAIPGATNLDWVELIDQKTQRFKGPDELARIFREHGIRLDRPSVTHCQSGGRAAVMAFALELMGAKEVRNYYKGWSEWGNDPDTPIVTPKPKK